MRALPRAVAVEALIGASKASGPACRPRLLARLLAAWRAYLARWVRR